ncbi:UDP-N-acetylmuramate--L-alanine ligase [Williamsia sterculiae]|uniref:UDP-N-acetylmuramate--L-alanine ligase n=1 Tax=Williamsia sterculiae TaxID=1344003 RepID=A0A1N7H715_9NOCA|nr:UDP-N-acetylmuramate--L-alanine ligase [Williamsia sterculiae]SIS20563.1 UDP-N-acetylmuramate--L-alanine ligase [Williamsia sterculiae]
MNRGTLEDSDLRLPVELERVHMVGIGGAGMSGLARILLSRGGDVSGSDAKESRGVIALRARGALIRIGHDPAALDLLPGGPTVVVTTHAAIPKTNPELVAAAERGIPVLLRPRVLAMLMAGHRTLLIAGTHGKTSTTSMAVVALQHAGLDPSFAVGGELNESGTNAHHGAGGIFVAEADESDGSLLEYTPDVVVVTNIEADHLDFFGTVEAYVQVFDDFVDRIAPGGVLVICLDDPGAVALAQRTVARFGDGRSVLGYGRGTLADRVPTVTNVARLDEWQPHAAGGQLRVTFADVGQRTLAITLPGEHMALNALGAIVGAVSAGSGLDETVTGVESFSGVHRRFQLRGDVAGVAVYDDYAHHPTEVRATLTGARHIVDATGGRVIAVFQPHLYSRTEAFAAQFATALDLADQVVVLDVYGAREEPIAGVSGRSIADLVTVPVLYQPDLSAVADQVAALARPGDLILTVGAGDITMQGPEIVEALRVRQATDVPDDPTSGGPHV